MSAGNAVTVDTYVGDPSEVEYSTRSMLAITFCDYPMANHGLRFARQRELLSQRRLLSLGFGAARLHLGKFVFVSLQPIGGATQLGGRRTGLIL